MTRRLGGGEHISVDRGGHTRHGIYVGNGRVVEQAKPREGGMIRVIDLSEFAAGAPVRILHYHSLRREHVMSRAMAAVEWPAYDLWGWDCEGFAKWCATG